MGFFTIRPMRIIALTMGLLLLCGGCTVSRTYEVSVRNDTSGPITIWLTKDGPPEQEAWLSPEQIAIDPTRATPEIGGVVVPAGKTASTGPTKGQFYSDVNAVLRVYEGQFTLAQLLAISRGSPNRIDTILPLGDSKWVVSDDTKLEIKPAGGGK